MPRHASIASEFWIALIGVAFSSALCLLILGIFTLDGGPPAVMMMLTVVLLAGPLFLLWLLGVRWFLSRVPSGPRASAGGSTPVTKAWVYGIGALVVLSGSWHMVQQWSDAPAYQEAFVGATESIPAY